MKIWISKNSEVPVGEQLIAQITLAIVAGDLDLGEKLPSTRELARRCDLHANTVGSAYRKLVVQNLLEFKKGSGFYVAESAGARIEGTRRLEQLIRSFFDSARALGFERAAVMSLMKAAADHTPTGEVVVVESDSALQEILVHELSGRFPATVGVTLEDYAAGKVPSGATLAAMLDEKPKIEPLRDEAQRCVYLMGRSVAASMSDHIRPRPDEILAVVSGWDGFLSFARIMLLAARVDPGRLIIRSTEDDGWKTAIRTASVIICDTLTAASLESRGRVMQFQIISDESLEELAEKLD